MNSQALSDWTEYAYQLAERAGEKIMFYYRQTGTSVEYKADASPLTEADKAAHEIIYEGLSHFKLNTEGKAPVLSEEGKVVPFIERQAWQRYWCVDPLDGTKEFLVQNDEFTVNIALINEQRPIVGVVYVPAKKEGYLAWQGGGAYHCDQNGIRHQIKTRVPFEKPLRVIVSRHYHLDTIQPWLSLLGETTLVYQGSALKFCALARGQADLFLRLSPTSEWDNAAGHCILEEAGGTVFALNGEPLIYNRSGTLQQGKFISVGDKSANWSKLLVR